MKNKKGIALNQAFGAILTLVLVAVLVIVGILIFVNLISGAFTNLASAAETITGEALTPSGDGVAVGNATACGFGSFAIVTATNSSGSLLNAANYTTVASTGVVINTSSVENGQPADAPWTLNYTHNTGGPACTASQTMITQFATYPALVGLVGTIIFLGIVIGVLVASFVFGRREGV